ncbi:MAG: hypothetical protein JO266_03455 [Acidobacteria bacterium]|nr:hypothetical protein [Acidobacteriota bacterium]
MKQTREELIAAEEVGTGLRGQYGQMPARAHQELEARDRQTRVRILPHAHDEVLIIIA